MVTTLSPNARDTPTKPIPTCGKPAAMTALPHPAKVSQNVPIASAAYFLYSLARLPHVLRCWMLERPREGPRYLRKPGPYRPNPAAFSWRSQARNRLLRWTSAVLSGYMPALRVKGQAFAGPFTLPEFLSDQLKEDAACRFSSAITMSIKPSRR